MTYEPVSLEHLLAHERWAKRIALRLVRGEAEAEDLVQRAWLAALRTPPSGQRGIRAWIRRVILNLARERHRVEKAREHHERASYRQEVADDTLDLVSKEEIREGLCQRLLELEEPYRSVVIERYYDGRSSAQIARRLGIPTGTVRWRLKVGLDRLRAKLDRGHGGDRSRWVSAFLAYLGPEGLGAGAGEATESATPHPSPAFWGGLAAVGLVTVAVLRGVGSRSDAIPVLAASLSSPAEESLLVEAAAPPRGSSREILGAIVSEPTTSSPTGVASAGLRIRVVDEQGVPVPEALTLVAGPAGFERRGRADADGLVRLAVLPGDAGALHLPSVGGRISLRVLASGRVASECLHVAPPFTFEREVRIPVGGVEAVVEGRVVDSLGAGVPGAAVTWYERFRSVDSVPEGDFFSPGHLSTRCDGDGRFRLAHLPSRTIALVCQAPGFALCGLSVDTREANPPLTIPLVAGASVTGTVRWPDGRPAANVQILCDPIVRAVEWATGIPGYDLRSRGFAESTRSEEDGRFRLEHVGSLYPRILWARDESSGLTANVELRLEDGEEQRWEATLGESTGFRLRLEDRSGRPMPGWSVFLRRPIDGQRWWIRRAAADGEGRLLIPDCPNQPAFLEVFGPTETGPAFVTRTLRPGPQEQVLVVDTGAVSLVTGTVMGLEGLPETDGLLVFYSRQTGLGTRVERDERGGFSQRLAPGSYVLALELKRTATPLGSLEVGMGERHWMGTMVTPTMGFLRLNSEALFNGSAREPHYELARLGAEGTQAALDLGPGLFPGNERLSMFPGRYRLLSYDASGSPSRRHVFTIRSNAELELDLEP